MEVGEIAVKPVKSVRKRATMKEKLRRVLEREGHNQNTLAELLEISYQSVSIKINGKKDFTRSEIFKIKIFYKLTAEELVDIFFSMDDLILGSDS